ncbi:MAG: hypothetical protein ABSF71_33410 [Terriglobia bacterium]|jgi:hypothetical protein
MSKAVSYDNRARYPQLPWAGIILPLLGRLPISAFLLLAIALSACAPRTGGKYQIRRTEEGLLVVPPPYWQEPPGKPIKLQLVPSQSGVSASGCSADSGLFRASLARGSSPKWSVTLPSWESWQASLASGSFPFDHFLDELGKLETRGCLSAGAGALLEQAVRESVPVMVHDSLRYRYDWQEFEGFIGLEPGMRLRIERAEYNPAGKIAGTSTTYYQIERDSHRAIAFRLLGPKQVNTPDDALPDRNLATSVRDMFYARLFLSGAHVPNNLRYTALIAGTRTRERMEEIAESLKEHPDTGCPQGPEQQVNCMIFRGPVTASVELQVSVNGQQVFAGLERDVRSLFDEPARPCALRSLRVERRYLNKYVPVEFSIADDSVLGLMLVGGDRIVCPAPPESPN